MNYEEYHLHDKDRNAIRTEGRRKSLREPASAKKSALEPSEEDVVAAPAPSSPEPQTKEIRTTEQQAAVGQGYQMPFEEERILQFSDMILFGIAGLLLLVMVYLRRKRERD